jgi:thioredoxin reductase (NADPH)
MRFFLVCGEVEDFAAHLAEERSFGFLPGAVPDHGGAPAPVQRRVAGGAIADAPSKQFGFPGQRLALHHAGGEDENLGRGVSYCATCDAPLYRGKTAAVIGYSPREEAEAAFLSEVCSEVSYFPMYKEETSLPEKVRVIREKVTGIAQEDGRRIVQTEKGTYAADGVFVLREAVAPDTLVPGLEADGPHVRVNRKMETSLPGVFACGDLTGTPYQYIKAAGEGNVAAISAAAYIDTKK